MSAAQPAPDVPNPVSDRRVGRSERRLSKLEHLSDRALEHADAVPTDGSTASAEAFAKFSRAVRLTITLEEKLDEALSAYLAGEVAKAEIAKEQARKDPYAKLKTGQTARVVELVRDVIDREIPDPKDHDLLTDALDERLLFDEAYAHIDDLPLREVLERLCADLKLRPDWKRWAGDGWKPSPPFARPLCSYFKAPSRRPILAEPPEPGD